VGYKPIEARRATIPFLHQMRADRLRKDSQPGASSIFIANRGDVAIRVTRCARALGLRSVVAVIPSERSALHAKLADEVAMVPSYSDGAALIAAALEHKCFAVHPGWGFLSEDAAFAQSCVDASLVWVGCSPRVLALFGDKLCARQFVTEQCFLYGVRTIPGSETSLDLRGTIEFARAHAPAELMLKAVEGGGGRGIRKITVGSGGAEDVAEITSAFKRCVAEAGATRVFVERCVADAMHIEVQLAGNGSVVRHIGTRDCTLQRSRQKVIEIAPAPSLSAPLRARLLSAALAIGRRSRLDSLATVEFLLVGESVESSVEFYFLEVNPRLQVEHTVTEEAFGVAEECRRLELDILTEEKRRLIALREVERVATIEAGERHTQELEQLVQQRVSLETMVQQIQTNMSKLHVGTHAAHAAELAEMKTLLQDAERAHADEATEALKAIAASATATTKFESALAENDARHKEHVSRYEAHATSLTSQLKAEHAVAVKELSYAMAAEREKVHQHQAKFEALNAKLEAAEGVQMAQDSVVETCVWKEKYSVALGRFYYKNLITKEKGKQIVILFLSDCSGKFY
jgi:biotin carboxylase